MGALKLNPNWNVKTNRVKRLKDKRWLFDAFLEKMQEIDSKGLALAIEMRNGNFIVGLAGKAGTALKIREKTNNNDGVMVEAVQYVGGGKKGHAWCMYYQQVLIAIAEVLTGLVSLFPYSGSCASVRAKAVKISGLIIDKKNSIFGTIEIKKYPKTGLGHTETFDHWDNEKKLIAVMNGGNTTQGKLGGEVIREGGGTYETLRTLDNTWVMALNAFSIQGNAPITEPDETASDKGEIPKLGERSDNVATYQKALVAKGLKVTVDGWFWNETKKATAKFQKDNSLKGSGIPGPETMKLLGL